MKNNASYLTTKDVADRLMVQEPTVWKWIREGQLTATKVGRRYLISPRDLDDFLKKRRKEASE